MGTAGDQFKLGHVHSKCTSPGLSLWPPTIDILNIHRVSPGKMKVSPGMGCCKKSPCPRRKGAPNIVRTGFIGDWLSRSDFALPSTLLEIFLNNRN